MEVVYMQCPNCTNETNWIEEHSRWYCYTCQGYLPEGYGAQQQVQQTFQQPAAQQPYQQPAAQPVYQAPPPKKRTGLIVGVVVIVLVVAMIGIAYLFWWGNQLTEGETEEFGAATVTVNGDDLHISIVSMNQKDITEIKYQLLDEYGGPKSSNSGNIYGEPIDVLVVDRPESGAFYESDYDTNPLNMSDDTMPYYYVVFIDTDSNEKVNSGDRFIVKSTANGGVAEEDDIFRIKDDVSKKVIIEVRLPAV